MRQATPSEYPVLSSVGGYFRGLGSLRSLWKYQGPSGVRIVKHLSSKIEDKGDGEPGGNPSRLHGLKPQKDVDIC